MARLSLIFEDREDGSISVSLEGECGNPFNPEREKLLTQAQRTAWTVLSELAEKADSARVETWEGK